MTEKLSELEAILRHEITLCGKFLALVKKKKEVIIANDISQIEALTGEENETLEQIEELGFNRQELVLNLSKQPKLRPTEHLKDLLKQLPDVQKAPLVQLREQLLGLYNDISEHSKLNGELLAQSHRFNQHLIRRITAADKVLKTGGTYQRFASKKNSAASAAVPSILEYKG